MLYWDPAENLPRKLLKRCSHFSHTWRWMWVGERKIRANHTTQKSKVMIVLHVHNPFFTKPENDPSNQTRHHHEGDLTKPLSRPNPVSVVGTQKKIHLLSSFSLLTPHSKKKRKGKRKRKRYRGKVEETWGGEIRRKGGGSSSASGCCGQSHHAQAS